MEFLVKKQTPIEATINGVNTINSGFYSVLWGCTTRDIFLDSLVWTLVSKIPMIWSF